MPADNKITEGAATVAKKLFEGRNIKVNWAKNWHNFKHKCIQFFGGLLMEKNDDGHYVASMGRISWWIAFLPAIHIWASGKGLLSDGEALKDISPNHLNVLVMLAAYNFGKKAIDAANNMWGRGKAAPSGPPTAEDGPG